ncbi:Hit1p [Kluyveromyces lactis]|uniref:KLLA0C14564p n=1 Tax=Kluyveromyces lactis (strain ATCC 8585 / CBS 2359 / DSM 70799 / NBRC 1267 / NRRL Y-1140 / WM37) TaxID=284590 RepID=Q6CT87_KLULA|nr:uncharacterized protein KLLA0_C14564g [Kluyveromyces lactis]CAH01703.1 KLLA0C14564p [Kluyveromyces lactis]|eukprot:XP_452852.1 uncharacterized protein KLLA0_C14564g [Kluyveromyces lactis]
MVKCEVCGDKEALYRCPKSSVRYCSLVCYKNIKKSESDNVESNKTDPESNSTTVKEADDTVSVPGSQTDSVESVPTPLNKYQYALTDSRIRELLRHNTVKFHLDKVYKILNVSTVGGSSDASMTSDMKRELATDYLNTLRTGGIHCNEAIEEFCQIFLELLREHI